MTHGEIEGKILGLYDGPISERERRWVEKHLAFCRTCQGRVKDYKRAAALLFAVPRFSEEQEDIFTAKVLTKVISLRPALRSVDSAVRWLFPLLGSTVAAAWIFFSVIPNTPGLSEVMNGSVFFSADANEWADILPSEESLSNEELVVSWLKK